MAWQRLGEVVSVAALVDVLINGAQFLTVLSDVVLTPAILFAFTILPNIDTSGVPWLQDVFVGAVIILGVVALLNALTTAVERYRRKNDN